MFKERELENLIKSTLEQNASEGNFNFEDTILEVVNKYIHDNLSTIVKCRHCNIQHNLVSYINNFKFTLPFYDTFGWSISSGLDLLLEVDFLDTANKKLVVTPIVSKYGTRQNYLISWTSEQEVFHKFKAKSPRKTIDKIQYLVSYGKRRTKCIDLVTDFLSRRRKVFV